MLHRTKHVSSVLRRAQPLYTRQKLQFGAAHQLVVREYAKAQKLSPPPLSQNLEQNSPPPGPPPRSIIRRLAYGVGISLSVVAVGGALLLFDPLGLTIEKKRLAPAPNHPEKKAVNVYQQASVPTVKHTTGAKSETKKAVKNSEQKTHVDSSVDAPPPVMVDAPPPLTVDALPPVTVDAPAKAPAKADVATPVTAEEGTTSSIARMAEDSVQLLISGKRTVEEMETLAQREREEQLAREKAAKLELAKQKKLEEENLQHKLREEAKLKQFQGMLQTISKELSEALESMHSVVVLNQRAGDICEERARLLRKALEAETNSVAQEYWPRLAELREETMHQISHAVHGTEAVRSLLSKVTGLIAEARACNILKSDPTLDSYEEQAKRLIEELNASVSARDGVITPEEVMRHFYDIMQGERGVFENELASLPNFKPGNKGESFTDEELSELLKYAHRKVYELQRQLQELDCLRELRWKEAMEKQKEALEADYLVNLKEELNKQRQRYKQELETELSKLAKRDEQKMQDELSRQGLAKVNHAEAMLKVQEKQLIEHFKARMQERIVSERTDLLNSVDDAFVKVEKLVSHAHEKADVSEIVTKLQKLVSSARYLQLILEEPGGDLEESELKFIDISQAVADFEDSAPDDAFIKTILNSLSDTALTRGVYTLASLEERFNRVLKECKKDALFPNSTNFFSSYLSRLYSRLLLFNVKPTYETVSEFYENGVDGMDTKDLLVQAQHFMSTGDVAEATKCMVQLKGLPRQFAHDWINEALLCLEVHQAAEAILDYALSLSLNQVL